MREEERERKESEGKKERIRGQNELTSDSEAADSDRGSGVKSWKKLEKKWSRDGGNDFCVHNGLSQTTISSCKVCWQVPQLWPKKMTLVCDYLPVSHSFYSKCPFLFFPDLYFELAHYCMLVYYSILCTLSILCCIWQFSCTHTYNIKPSFASLILFSFSWLQSCSC